MVRVDWVLMNTPYRTVATLAPEPPVRRPRRRELPVSTVIVWVWFALSLARVLYWTSG
jgi:hypothetical protein